jgi:hypothetical protein
MLGLVIQVAIGVMVLVDVAVQSALGWRYLLSPQFRRQVHGRMITGSRISKATRFAGYVTFFLVGNAILILVVVYIFEAGAWLYDGIVAPRLAHGG